MSYKIHKRQLALSYCYKKDLTKLLTIFAKNHGLNIDFAETWANRFATEIADDLAGFMLFQIDNPAYSDNKQKQ